MIILMNGAKAVRVKSSSGEDGVTVLDCGCAYSSREYLQMCAGPGTERHYEDWKERHEAAAIAHTATLAGGMP